MADLQKIAQLLNRLDALSAELRAELGPEAAATGINPDSFEGIKELLESDRWPKAVSPQLICSLDDDDDKIERGEGAIELVVEEELAGLRFLDFGCGEGHVTLAASTYKPEVAVGYDPFPQASWSARVKDGLVLTDDYQLVRDYGPYDVIMLFDVVDHVVGDTPVEALKKAASVLKPDGKIYMRCHPFVSRHGTHVYHDLNRAFVHLVLTDEEMKALVPNPRISTPSQRVCFPLRQYHEIIERAGLHVHVRREVTEKPEAFFKAPSLANRICKNMGVKDFPEYQMSLSFVDFQLKLPKE